MQDPTVHTPLEHVPFAFGGAQDRPHAPQFVVLEATSLSQPLLGSPSQSANPARHDATAHPPDRHAPMAFAGAHTLPQPPQLARLEPRLTSQPFAELPSQSAKPLAHTKEHADDAQVAEAFVRDGHGAPQRPQFVMDAVRSVSQPLASLPSQFPEPALHAASTHAPATHDGDAWAKPHARPHEPQLDVFEASVTSHPSAGSPLQSAKPALHRATAQAPAVHAATPSATRQTAPHVRQFITSAWRSVSQPFAATPSQSARPGAHVERVHTPPEHDPAPPGKLQAFAQIPQ